MRVTCLLLAAVCHLTAATNPDTEKLASHLRLLRGLTRLSPDEYTSLRKEYLTWLDIRVRSGWNANELNWDLANAGLVLPPGEKSEEHTLRHAPDLLALTVTIDPRDSGSCGRNITVVFYDRNTLRRLAEIDPGPEPEAGGYHLAGIDAGERDYAGRRLIATRWAASKCASHARSERFRIDQVKGTAVKNILTRDLSTVAGGDDHASTEVNSNVVTFRYNTRLMDTELTVTPSIARYRIDLDRATRLSPIAFSRAGFIQEWLTMTDANPADWATPEAVQQRAAIAAELDHGTFEWGRIAKCGGGVWDIVVILSKADTRHAFRLSGNRASELRILAISDTPDDSCHIVDDLTAVDTELLW